MREVGCWWLNGDRGALRWKDWRTGRDRSDVVFNIFNRSSVITLMTMVYRDGTRISYRLAINVEIE